MFEGIKAFMDKTGHIMYGGRIVGVTIINAPSATKNAEHVRDPEMHQTKARRPMFMMLPWRANCCARMIPWHMGIQDISALKNVPKSQKMSICPRWKTSSTAATANRNRKRFIENRKSSVRSKVEHPFRFP